MIPIYPILYLLKGDYILKSKFRVIPEETIETFKKVSMGPEAQTLNPKWAIV